MAKHYTEIYLLTILNTAYLVVKRQGRSIMVWDNIEKIKTDLTSLRGAPLLGFNPVPIRVTKEQFPGIEDMYLNEFISYLTDSSIFDTLSFKEIDELEDYILLPINTEKVKEYLLPR